MYIIFDVQGFFLNFFIYQSIYEHLYVHAFFGKIVKITVLKLILNEYW